MSVTVSQRLIQTNSIIANQAYTSDKTFAVMDPATDKWVANVCSVDTQGIELALESAQSAFERKESRGAHAYVDYPKRDDKTWHCHSLYFAQDHRIGKRGVSMVTKEVKSLPLQARGE